MHQVLFNIGSLEIRVYGVMTAIAFLTGIYLSSMLAKKRVSTLILYWTWGLSQ